MDLDPRPQDAVDLLGRVVRSCRRRRRAWKIADSTGAELSGVEVLARALVLRRLLRRLAIEADEQYVAVLLPPTAAAAVVNLALALDRRTIVNLNYSLSPELLNACIAQAGVQHVVTSRKFVERLGGCPGAEMVYLEDLRAAPTLLDKMIAAVQAAALPAGLLLRMLGLHRVGADDVMSVLFTSGYTGEPKGVMLTYANVAHNVTAAEAVIRLRSSDVLIGVLPFFHAFGATVTLWTVLATNVAAAYHTNPLEARAIGRLCRERRGTILLATSSFLRGYLKRCPAEDLASLEVIATGAEKLSGALSDACHATLGIRPVEGYGATETAPMVAANVPPSRALGDPAISAREGTVGRPVPGVRVKVVDPETGAEVGPGQPGILWVTGPNVMKGYLNRPEATADVLREGWYVTGDVVIVDDDGFIRIVGRASRFAKIGGEMVPFARVEEALAELLGTDDEGGPLAVVTAVPDPVAGERLVMVHAPLPCTPAEVCRGLAASGLPRLFLPSPADFCEVDRLPTVGIGKVDLRRVDELAKTGALPRGRETASVLR